MQLKQKMQNRGHGLAFQTNWPVRQRDKQEIRRLVRASGFTEKSMIIAKKARLFLEDAFRKNEKFDIIFLDPPYHTEEIENVLSDLGEMNLLETGGVVVAEHFIKRKLPTISGRLQLIKDYTYGDTVLSVYS